MTCSLRTGKPTSSREFGQRRAWASRREALGQSFPVPPRHWNVFGESADYHTGSLGSTRSHTLLAGVQKRSVPVGSLFPLNDSNP